MRRLPILSLLLLLTPWPAEAQTELLVGPVEIVGYGIFSPRYTGDQEAATSEHIGVDGVGGGSFLAFTTTVDANKDRVFGIQYVINSQPKGALFNVTQVVEIPDEGIKTPGGRVYKTMRDKARVPIGQKVFFGYGFDFPWEKVPGEWTIQIWHEQYKLAERKFNVIVPDEDVAEE